jgi:multicomponent Na+:H+ antiporter subunit G
MLLDLVSAAAAVIGLGFFAAGTTGLIRFPDLYTRLHAITKADTLGLGFIALAVALQAPTVWLALKALLVWVVALAASAIGCNLMAGRALRTGRAPLEGPPR